MSTENKMREISIDKVTVNMGVGEPGDQLKKAQQIIETLTGAKTVKTKGKVRLPKWNVRPGLELGTKTTLRGKRASEFLVKALGGVENTLRKKQFDKQGNFGFGIKEYIDIPGVKYDPTLGIRGMDVLVTLKRPGYRVKIRKNKRTKLGKNHIITRDEGIEFMKNKFGVQITEG